MKVYSRGNKWKIWTLRFSFVLLSSLIFWLVEIGETDYIYLVAFIFLLGAPIRLASLDIYQDRIVLNRHYFFGLFSQTWRFRKEFYLRKFAIEFNPILNNAIYSADTPDDLLPVGCLLFSFGLFTPDSKGVDYKAVFTQDVGYGESKKIEESVTDHEYHLLKDIFKASENSAIVPTQNPS
jgi:hypothetical protein